jgi:hypothetical protein
MSTRSVRLDDAAERVLARLRRLTGLSISDLLRRGLAAYEQVTRNARSMRPYEIYARLELKSGGWAAASARKAKHGVHAAISSRAPRQQRFRDYVREKRRRWG